MSSTGVEPDVQGVADLVVVGGLITEQLGGVQLEPSLNALLLDTFGHLFHQLSAARVQLARGLVQEERDRDTPVALTRDAPVRTPGDHAVQACLAPGWDELSLLDGCQRTLTQGAAFIRLLVHADEPLRGCAVDQRGLMAPAVHIAVLDSLVLEQRADFFQLGDDGRIGLPDKLAAKERQVTDIHAVALHRAEDVVIAHAVAFAGTEVVLTIGRRRVHHASAGAQLNVVSQIDRGKALIERMTKAEQLQRCTWRGGDHVALQAITGQAAFHQLFGQQQQTLAGIDQRIGKFRVDVQRLVGRNGPRRGGPDHDGSRLRQAGQTKCGGQLVGISHYEGDVDGIGLFVLVLDFGLSQRGTAVETPVDRFQTLEYETLFDHLGQRADFARFVGKVHGFVRVVPVAQYTEAHEVGLLPFDLLTCIGTAALAGQVGRLILAKGGFHLVLNRQTVTVPARHIGSVETGQGLGTGDDVLENLVDRMTDVNAAIGIGRAVVQNKLRPTFALRAQLLIQANLVPALQNLRLALRQGGLHRKLGVRQIKRGFVIGHFRLFVSDWHPAVEAGRLNAPMGTGGSNIGSNSRLQCLKGGETLLIAQLVVESHRQTPAI